MKKRCLLFRIPCLLLCMAMIVTILAACKSNGEGEGNTSTATDSQSETVDPGPQYEYDEDGYIMDRLPDGISLNYRDMNILQWNSYQQEFITSAGSDNISQALYYRVIDVESRLQCVISLTFEAGDWGAMTPFIQKVYNDSQAGISEFDLIGQYSFVAPTAAMYGLYANLAQPDYLDFEMPWWDSDLLESAQLSNKVYFVTGDIAPTSIYQNFCMFFNHDMLTDYQNAHGYTVNDLYDLVLEEGGWTLEVLKTITTDIYEDKNNSGVKDAGDLFGLDVFDFPHYDAFFYAADMKVIEKTSNDNFVLSPQFTGLKTVDLIDELKAYLIDNDDVFEGNGAEAFREGRAMFALATFDYPLKKLTDASFDYGVLPVPKYDSDQKEYRSSLAAPYTLYSIPLNAESISESEILMEALASEAYRSISPVIYEQALKLRYAGEYSENAEIYDLIRSSRVYDVGRIYGNIMSNEGSGAAFALFRNTIQYNGDWGSSLNKMKTVYVEQLRVIQDAFALLD